MNRYCEVRHGCGDLVPKCGDLAGTVTTGSPRRITSHSHEVGPIAGTCGDVSRWIGWDSRKRRKTLKRETVLKGPRGPRTTPQRAHEINEIDLWGPRKGPHTRNFQATD